MHLWWYFVLYFEQRIPHFHSALDPTGTQGAQSRPLLDSVLSVHDKLPETFPTPPHSCVSVINYVKDLSYRQMFKVQLAHTAHSHYPGITVLNLTREYIPDCFLRIYVCIYMEYYFCHEKEWNRAMCNNMDRPWGHMLSEISEVRMIKTVWLHLHVEFFKKSKQNKAKKIQACRHNEQIGDCQRRGWESLKWVKGVER